MDHSIKSQLDKLSSFALYRPIRAIVDRRMSLTMQKASSATHPLKNKPPAELNRSTSLNEHMISVTVEARLDQKSGSMLEEDSNADWPSRVAKLSERNRFE
jgi:hypothetical protein